MFVDEKAVGEKQPVQLGTLKLSGAIRIGAKLRPQATGRLFRDGASCALGAAYEGAFGAPPPEVWGDWHTVGITANSDAWMRLRAVFPHATYETVGMRNDRGESRESIAAWLESQGL